MQTATGSGRAGGMDFLHLAQHHVFSDEIVPLLPLQALGCLQATCAILQHSIQAVPEAAWTQAAHTELPAYHPIFISLRPICAYLGLHHSLHRAFAQPPAPSDPQPEHVNLAADLTPSHDFTMAAISEDATVTVLDLTTWLPIATVRLPDQPLGRPKYSLHWSPSDTHICIVVQSPRPSPPHGICRRGPLLHTLLVLDVEAGCVVASPLNAEAGLDIRFVAWAPNSRLLLVKAWPAGRSARYLYMLDSAGCPMRETHMLTHCRDCIWSCDSCCVAAVAQDGVSIIIWDLEEDNSRVSLPAGSGPVQSLHWAPDSASICCLTKGGLTSVSRKGALLKECQLTMHPAFICLGLSGMASLQRSSFEPGTCTLNISTVGPDLTLAQRLSVQLPIQQFCGPPCASPDGSFLAVALLQKAELDQDSSCAVGQMHTLAVVCVATAVTRTYALDLHASSIRWAADGASVFVSDAPGRRFAVLRLAS